MTRAYIASPYTNGDREENINLQLDVADILMNYGIAPYAPVLTHFQSLKHPRPEIEWLQLQKVYLEICDILIRFRVIKNGKEILSLGSDGEEEFAKDHGIPVYTFYTIKELKEFLEHDNPYVYPNSLHSRYEIIKK